MGVEHECGLVIGVLYVFRGIEAKAGKYGMRYGDGQRVEKVHFELVARYPFQHTASGSCFEPLKVICAVIRYGVCRRSEYSRFY